MKATNTAAIMTDIMRKTVTMIKINITVRRNEKRNLC